MLKAFPLMKMCTVQYALLTSQSRTTSPSAVCHYSFFLTSPLIGEISLRKSLLNFRVFYLSTSKQPVPD